MVSGKAQSGKDTFAKILMEQYPDAKIKRFGFADRLKSMALEFGWNGSKEGEGRSFLIDLGQILRGDYTRKEDGVYSNYTQVKTVRETYDLGELYDRATRLYPPHPDFWASLVVQDICNDSEVVCAVITDWRFKSEFYSLDKAFPCRVETIRITSMFGLQIEDQSEKDLDNFRFMHHLPNFGSLELYTGVIKSWFDAHWATNEVSDQEV